MSVKGNEGGLRGMKMWEEEKKERTGEKLNLGLKNVLYNYQAGSEG